MALHHAPAAEAVDAALLTLPPPGSSGFLRTAPDRNVRLAVRKCGAARGWSRGQWVCASCPRLTRRFSDRHCRLGTVERGKQGNRSDGLGVRAVPWPGHVDQTAAGNGKMEAADIEVSWRRSGCECHGTDWRAEESRNTSLMTRSPCVLQAMRQRMEKYRRKRASRALQRRKFGEDAA